MDVKSIGTSYANLLKSVSSGNGDTSGDFQSILADAIDQANSTDTASQVNAEALLTGDVNNLHDAVIDSEKATIALSLTVQIRNKVIDAYNEVMRMQV